MDIFISRENKQNNNRIQMTEEYRERKYSGALQQKVWNLGELMPEKPWIKWKDSA